MPRRRKNRQDQVATWIPGAALIGVAVGAIVLSNALTAERRSNSPLPLDITQQDVPEPVILDVVVEDLG